jgi:hypothetical protein
MISGMAGGDLQVSGVVGLQNSNIGLVGGKARKEGSIVPVYRCAIN